VKQNQSAFPLHDSGHGQAYDKGMTLRDYFAAKAMQTQSWTFYLGDYETHKSLSNTAKNCYEIADAMMKAREA
jgi:hypothetical protein